MKYAIIFLLMTACGEKETVYIKRETKLECRWDFTLNCPACRYYVDDINGDYIITRCERQQ